MNPELMKKTHKTDLIIMSQKKTILHKECEKCPRRLKKYCTGTYMNQKFLLCTIKNCSLKNNWR